MTNSIFQTNFGNGEISPHLHARVDIDLYANGAKTIRNFFVKPQAGVCNRAGTEFVGVCRGQNLDPSISDVVRLIPFQFNEQDSYALEFGHKYMRVIRNGGYVLETDEDSNVIQRSIVSITTATEAVVTLTTDGTKPVYGSGSHVQFVGAYKRPRFDDGSQDVRSTSVVSEKIIDLGSDYQNIEDELSARCVVGTAFVGASATLTFHVQTSNSRLFTTFETMYSSSALAVGSLTAGAVRINNIVLNDGTRGEIKRYLRLFYEVGGTGGFTAGTVAGTLLVNDTNAVPYDEINNKIFIVSDRVGDTMKLKYFDGAYLDTSEYFEAQANSGRLQRIFTKSMPYKGEDLHLLKFVQDADVMTITHPDYEPRILTRQGHAIWNLARLDFKPPLLAPTGVTATPSVTASADTTYRYKVTCVNKAEQESRPSAIASAVSVAMSAPVASGSPYPNISLSWTANSGAKRYKIYRQQEVTGGSPSTGSMYGYVGHTESNSFTDQNVSPDFTEGPPEIYNPFVPTTASITTISQANPAGVLYTGTPSEWAEGDLVYISGIGGMTQFVDGYYTIRSMYGPPDAPNYGMTFYNEDGETVDSTSWTAHTSNTGTIQKLANNPSCSAYFQQRRVFAGSSRTPQGVWMTKTGDYDNMDIRYPVRDDDSIEFNITAGTSGQINQINHLVSTQSLLALTLSGAFRISGADNGGAISPSSINVKPQSISTGANHISPVVMNTDVLYVQSKGSTVRALAYDFYSDSYKADDISFRSKHLLEASPIREWAYASEPDNILYCVREDGKILMLSYLKEAQTIAWSWGDSVGDSGRDRFRSVCTISENGEDVVYFVVTRYICNERGCKFYKYVERMHSRNLYTDGIPDIKKAYFVDCGRYYQGTPIDRMSGLDHLEGCTVSVLLDGSVHPPVIVRNGTAVFNRYGSFIAVGLPYTCELETLPLDRGNLGISGKMKTINRVTTRMVHTRGLEVGHDDSDMEEMKETEYDNTENPILFTGDREVPISSFMTQQASVKVKQKYPLPAEISGLILEVTLGDA
jgi:hypothetical protein